MVFLSFFEFSSVYLAATFTWHLIPDRTSYLRQLGMQYMGLMLARPTTIQYSVDSTTAISIVSFLTSKVRLKRI